MVLPDGKSIVGVDAKTRKTLIFEDINTKKAALVGNYDYAIQTLLYDKATETLFAGDCRGRIVQYKKEKRNHTFSLVKDYGHTGISAAYSSAQVGGFAFFGGWDNFFIAIDINERRLSQSRIESPFKHIFSLGVCHGLDQKVYMSIGGDNATYSGKLSDILDVTDIYEMKKGSSVIEKKETQLKKE